jgi:hypothetical protein
VRVHGREPRTDVRGEDLVLPSPDRPEIVGGVRRCRQQIENRVDHGEAAPFRQRAQPFCEEPILLDPVLEGAMRVGGGRHPARGKHAALKPGRRVQEHRAGVRRQEVGYDGRPLHDHRRRRREAREILDNEREPRPGRRLPVGGLLRGGHAEPLLLRAHPACAEPRGVGVPEVVDPNQSQTVAGSMQVRDGALPGTGRAADPRRTSQ